MGSGVTVGIEPFHYYLRPRFHARFLPIRLRVDFDLYVD